MTKKGKGKGKQQPKKKQKKFLDGIGVSVSMPGSTNKMTMGSVSGGEASFGVKRGVRNLMAPAAMSVSSDMTQPARINKLGTDGARITGRDFLGTINVNNHVSGDVRFSTLITPQMIPNSRMAQLASIFQRWMIIRMVFHFVTAVATSTAGQLISYIDYDPATNITNSQPINVNIASAHTKSTPFAVWSNSQVPYGRSGGWLFTDPTGDDARLDTAGQFILVCATNFGGTASLGNLYVEYDVAFAQGDSPSNAGTSPATAGSKVQSTAGGGVFTPLGTPVFAWNALGLTVTQTGLASRLTFPTQLGIEKYIVIVWLQTAAAAANNIATTALGFTEIAMPPFAAFDFPPTAVSTTAKNEVSIFQAAASQPFWAIDFSVSVSMAATDFFCVIVLPVPNVSLAVRRPLKQQVALLTEQLERLSAPKVD